MIANKVRPKIEKVIRRFPTEVEIYRNIKNEYNENDGEELICNVTGFYHTSESRAKDHILDKGFVKDNGFEYLMLVCNEVTEQIRVNDFLFIRGIKYKVLDLGNQNNLDIYYDLVLERCQYGY